MMPDFGIHGSGPKERSSVRDSPGALLEIVKGLRHGRRGVSLRIGKDLDRLKKREIVFSLGTRENARHIEDEPRRLTGQEAYSPREAFQFGDTAPDQGMLLS